jgi:hypothetical protein
MPKKRRTSSSSRSRKRAKLDSLSSALQKVSTLALFDYPAPSRPPKRKTPSPSTGLTSLTQRAMPPVLSLSPKQKPLITTRKPKLRAPTKVALGRSATATRKDPKAMPKALREAICGDYRKERKARREAMFAKGSAGKGRRNPGPRQLDWRAEACK